MLNSLAGFTCTVVVALISSSLPEASLTPFICPVIVTVPCFTPVTTPVLLSIDATEESELDQCMEGKPSVIVFVLPSDIAYTSLEGFTVSVPRTLHASAVFVSSRLPDVICTFSTVTSQVAVANSSISEVSLAGSPCVVVVSSTPSVVVCSSDSGTIVFVVIVFLVTLYVIVAFPVLFAVTVPSLDTVATLSFDDFHSFVY